MLSGISGHSRNLGEQKTLWHSEACQHGLGISKACVDLALVLHSAPRTNEWIHDKYGLTVHLL